MENFFGWLIASWLPSFVVIFFLLWRRTAPATKQPKQRRGIDRSLTYPRQFPCGWYRICDSEDVAKRGELKHIYVLGREMVVFRSDDEHAQVSVVDAFCVHMGANLGVGGKVVPGTSCLQCPFHLWEFDGKSGRCTKIPYLETSKIPEKVIKRCSVCFSHLFLS